MIYNLILFSINGYVKLILFKYNVQFGSKANARSVIWLPLVRDVNSFRSRLNAGPKNWIKVCLPQAPPPRWSLVYYLLFFKTSILSGVGHSNTLPSTWSVPIFSHLQRIIYHIGWSWDFMVACSCYHMLCHWRYSKCKGLLTYPEIL